MININYLLNEGKKILSNSFVKTPKLDAEILLSPVVVHNVVNDLFVQGMTNCDKLILRS